MPSMRILVVEDDPGIAAGLRLNLQQRGYAVDVADGVAAAEASGVDPAEAGVVSVV